MRTMLVSAAVAATVATSATADITASSGWEDTSSPAILGSFGNLFDWGYETADPYRGRLEPFHDRGSRERHAPGLRRLGHRPLRR